MRLSRDDELEGESASISTQKQILRDYANEQEFLVVDEYVDDGFSGTNFERPSFKQELWGMCHLWQFPEELSLSKVKRRLCSGDNRSA